MISLQQSVVDLRLGARRYIESEHILKPNQAKDSRRVIEERIRIGGAQFAIFEIRLSISWVDQQST